MSPYRTSGDVVTPHTLADLFAEARDLVRDDGLYLEYRVTPWRRIKAAVKYRADSLGKCLQRMSRSAEVEVRVVRDATLHPTTYTVYRRTLASDDGLHLCTLDELKRIDDARVSAGSARFVVQGDTFVFRVTSYLANELAPRFDAAYPWDELGLPPLLGVAWMKGERL